MGIIVLLDVFALMVGVDAKGIHCTPICEDQAIRGKFSDTCTHPHARMMISGGTELFHVTSHMMISEGTELFHATSDL
jgi:hypothetical protein